MSFRRMEFTKIVTLFILILVYNDRRKLVSAIEKTSTDAGAFQNEEGTKIEHHHLTALEVQAAGHGPDTGEGKGMFRDPEGNLLKGGFRAKEQKFYEVLATTEDPILKELRDFVPRYCGLRNVKAKNEDKEYTYLCIEDQTRGLTLTSVMDLKMGEQVWEPGEKEDKIQERESKYIAMRRHYGFSIPGAKFYDIDSEELKTYDRPFTHTMTPKEAVQVIYEFVNRQSGLKIGLVDNILVELRKIYSWFKRQRHYKFYGSSILIVYDTAILKRKQPTVSVRMIDFGHAVPNAENSREKDEKFMRGLRNLIGLLQHLEIAVRKYTNISDQPGASHRNRIMNDDEQETSKHVSQLPIWQSSDQIAGRMMNTGGKQLGFFKDLQGNLGKPNPQQEEIDFYETLSKTTDPILVELKQYVPQYFGTKTMEIENESVQFIHIENTSKDFEVPCRVDLRMGIKSRPDWAPPKPDDSPYEHQAMFAVWTFTFLGYDYYSIQMQPDTKLKKISGGYVRRMLPEEGIKMMYEFVNGEWGIKCGLVDSLLDELQKIESWFERQRHYRFYYSTMSLTYDAKPLDNFARGLVTESQCRSLKVSVKVRMADFGNTFTETEDEPDENYLEALRNLMGMLRRIRGETFQPKFVAD